MGILIEKIRVSGLRGLQNIEVNLDSVTVLTGMNNSGKTSFLKAMQIAFGNRLFITPDDFYIADGQSVNQITVDVKIVPVSKDGEIKDVFDEDWELLFKTTRIIVDREGNAIVPLRTIVSYDSISSTYRTKQYILPDWPPLIDNEVSWFQTSNGKDSTFHFDEMPFFYIDAQRDTLDDIKVKNSYLGKMISKIEYSKADIAEIEEQIKILNEKAVTSSTILSDIGSTLQELDTTMGSSGGVEITPFTKKIRDLNKGLSIHYGNEKDNFSMEYHGMGTRSWSSLLTLKSFIQQLVKISANIGKPLFPILAIEEPEAHLHPNAQKKLYTQIATIAGQKVISTHSPYIAASAELFQIRSFYKDATSVKCGRIDMSMLSPEVIRKIKWKVINTRGEIFFSKAIVFFEGETEEQALPIFAEQHFRKNPIEFGIDFIGVGGFGSYLPFLRVAESLKIPWFILSDGEKDPVEKIKKDLKNLFKREINIADESNIFILDDDCDFEKYLIKYNFHEEIKSALIQLHNKDYLEEQIKKKNGTLKERIKTADICDKCTQNIYKDVLRDYNGDQGFNDALYDCMVSQKTQFGPVIAETIIDSKKDLPPKIIELFNKIKSCLKEKC